jgi:hypothetical protein
VTSAKIVSGVPVRSGVALVIEAERVDARRAAGKIRAEPVG